MSSDYIIYALVAVGIFTAYMAVVHIFRRDRMRQRVQAAAGAYGLHEEDTPTPAGAIFAENILTVLGTNVRDQKDLTLLLAQAGIRTPHAVAYFLFFKRVVQPVLLVLGGLLFLKVIVASGGTPFLTKLLHLALAIMMLLTGLFGANLYVTNRRQRRQQELLWSFPEMLDLLLVCIESGLGLDAALARVCAELGKAHPEVAFELERTRVELTLLSDRTQALQNLAERTQIVPFKSLVAALVQTEKFGTSLLDTLRVLSEDQRTTRLLNAETRAARIPVLITIPLILCILPSFIIIILGPPIIKVMNQGGIFGSATPGD